MCPVFNPTRCYMIARFFNSLSICSKLAPALELFKISSVCEEEKEKLLGKKVGIKLEMLHYIAIFCFVKAYVLV